MRALLTNLHFALRLIRRSPGFYALVIALLSAGIGATTAMFSVVESALLKPLPYADAEDLTDILKVHPGETTGNTSVGTFMDWRAQATTFEQMAFVFGMRFSLSSQGRLPEKVDVAEVTEDFFPMFRLKPLFGRLLEHDDDRPDAPLVAVISADFWQTRFGASPDAVGRTMTLNGRPFTIVGVAPRGFAFGSHDQERTMVWIPFFGSRSAARVAETVKERDSDFLVAMGRRRHGVSFAEAQAQMTTIAKNLEVAYPNYYAKSRIELRDLHDALVGTLGRQLWLLFGAVGLVFVVVSANTASLLLARARRRRAELATRVALGAASSTLVVQVVSETLVLFGVGAVLGTALASALVATLSRQLLGGAALESAVVVRLDGTVVAAAVVTSLLVGLAVGLGPALVTARLEPAAVLKQASVGGGDHRSHATVRGLLVVTQLAVAFALLTGSALTVRAFVGLLRTPPGFDPDDLATAFIQLPERKYDTDDKVRAFYGETFQAIASLPGVTSVSGNSFLPMGGTAIAGSFVVEGRPPPAPGEDLVLGRGLVAPGYFETMRIPVLRGRDFGPTDTESGPSVVILTKGAADKFFPGEDPIGRRISWDGTDGKWSEIVGLVGDVRAGGLADPLRPEAYTPFAQTPFIDMYVAARTKTPEAVLAALPRLVQGLDPELAVSGLTTMETRVAGTIGDSHRLAILLGAFALVALVLATLGLFGLVSYATSERTRELAIRLALGSPPRAVVSLVVRGAMKLVAVGLGIGLLLSAWVAREIAASLPGNPRLELAVVAPIPIVLALAGLVACILPALRAVRTPPASALRYE